MLGDLFLIGSVLAHSTAARLRERVRDDRGEGAISTAIAVLIVAFLGAALYLIFKQILTSSGSKASTTVDNIGTGG